MLKSLTKLFFGGGSGGNRKNSGDSGQSTKRRDDFILIICQRNDIAKLEIQSADQGLARILGYSEEELKNRPFTSILPPHINELIADYLEYTGDGNDLSVVLSKVRDFSLIGNDGKNIPLSLRILPTTSTDNNPRFCLILRDTGLKKELGDGYDEVYRALKKDINPSETGELIEKAALMRDMEVVISYIKKGRKTSSIAVIALKDFNNIELKHGANAALTALREIALICKSNFREDDIIAKIGSNKIAILLLEADLENSMTPLNRLRWKINAYEVKADGQKFKLSSIISCTEISSLDTPASVLNRCERAITGDQMPSVTLLS